MSFVHKIVYLSDVHYTRPFNPNALSRQLGTWHHISDRKTAEFRFGNFTTVTYLRIEPSCQWRRCCHWRRALSWTQTQPLIITTRGVWWNWRTHWLDDQRNIYFSNWGECSPKTSNEVSNELARRLCGHNRTRNISKIQPYDAPRHFKGRVYWEGALQWCCDFIVAMKKQIRTKGGTHQE